jgi:hypothetical protein
MLFRQVPAARPNQQDSCLRIQLVGLTCCWVGVGDGSPHGIAQIDVAVDQIAPGGSVGILEIGHEDARPRIQGVDDHLSINGAGNFDAPVQQVGGQPSHSPVAVADISRLSQEIGAFALIEAPLALLTRREQLAPSRTKTPLKIDNKL